MNSYLSILDKSYGRPQFLSMKKDNKVAWSGGFGLADIKKKRPVTPDTIFGVGSVSETVTLAAFGPRRKISGIS